VLLMKFENVFFFLEDECSLRVYEEAECPLSFLYWSLTGFVWDEVLTEVALFVIGVAF
jgi:hypothetical protein